MKLQNVEAERKRCIDILQMSEVRWLASGTMRMENLMLYYSGSSDRKNRNSVAILIRNEIVGSVVQFIPYPDRVMLVQMKTNYRMFNLIQVHAPAADKDHRIGESYNQIHEIVKVTKRGEINIVMGDWNTEVGEQVHRDIEGCFGLG